MTTNPFVVLVAKEGKAVAADTRKPLRTDPPAGRVLSSWRTRG